MDPMLWEIAETATALRRAFDRRAVSLGVTRAQWRVLAKLNRTPGLRQVDLAEHLDMEAITLCRIVDRLAEAGLVERQADPQDRRRIGIKHIHAKCKSTGQIIRPTRKTRRGGVAHINLPK